MSFLNIIILFMILTHPSVKSEEILNIEHIRKSLGYPSDQLVVEDYLEKEKSAYSHKTIREEQNNLPTPFSPDRILKAFKVTGKNPSSFLPIIITVVARDSYRSDLTNKLETQLKALDATSTADGGRLPYGDFKISDDTNGVFLMMPETRVPSQSIHLDQDLPGVKSYLDKYPDKEPCFVSFLKIPETDVDVRVAQYMNTEDNLQELISISGGEKYFNRFGHLNEQNSMDGVSFKPDEPFHEMIIEVFKALNLEVLESPMLNPYRKEQKIIGSPIIVPDSGTISPPIVAPQLEALPREKPSEVTKPEPEDHSWRWLVGLLALLSVMGFAVKRYCSKRTVPR